MSLEEVVVRTDLFPGIEDMDFSVFSLYGYYELNHHAVIKTYEKIDVISLSARDACFLDLKAGNVTLFLDCLSFDAQGLLIENAISYNVGSMGVYTVFN
jgi:GntR family transcriptional regulator